MHIIQFWRILWARRLLIAATSLACLAGGIILMAIIPPRYESQARIMLGLLKPDPLSGETLSGPSANAYAATQTQLITDYVMASKVVEALGWFSSPPMLEMYENRSSQDRRDFAHWASQLIIDNTKVRLLDGSNILQITYRSNDPGTAKAVAETLQRVYIDTSLSMKREDAARQAAWFEQQADKLRIQLASAEKAKSEYERQNGVFMQDDRQDIETARLQMLTQQGVPTAPSYAAPVQNSPSSIELAQLDATIAQQSKVLGPNHPELQSLRERRSQVAQLVARDIAAQRAASSAAASASADGARALQRAIDAQKNQVLANSDKLDRLRQLQTEVNLRREQFTKSIQSAASYREQAAVADAGLSPLGPASTPSAPTFPKPLLIIPGCVALGFGFGLLLSLLLEFIWRRVRGVEDLKALPEVPVLGVVPSVGPQPARPSLNGLQTRLLSRKRKFSLKAA